MSLSTNFVLALPVHAQWSDDHAANTVVSEAPNQQRWPLAALTPDGMTWVVWLDRRGNDHQVRAQLLDQAGVGLLPAGGVLVREKAAWAMHGPGHDAIAASDGSCVIVCVDGSVGNPVNVYAHRIDGAGDPLWDANGVVVATDDEFLGDVEPRVVETSDGHFAIAWARAPGAVLSTGSLNMQVLDAGGNRLLGPAGISEVGGTNEKPGRCALAATPDGGWIVAWVRSTESSSRQAHLHARRYAADGAPLWPAPVVVSDGAPLFFGDRPRLLSDGSGGAVLAWQGMVGAASDVRVQHLDPQGFEQYPHDGAAASTAGDGQEFLPVLLHDAQGGGPTVYFGVSNLAGTTWGLSGQRFSPTGARLWGDSGKVLHPLDGDQESELRGVPYGDGALLFALERYTPFFDRRLVALRVDAQGDAVWSPAARLLSESDVSKQELSVGVDGAGMGIAVWIDDWGFEPDVLAQNVHPDGSLGLSSGCSASVYCLGAPNSAGNGASLGALGGVSVGLGNLTLEAGGAPPDQIGIFVFGDRQAQTPFGDGQLCIGGTVLRLLPAQVVSPTGGASHALDFAAAPADAIAPGSTWNFQFWYRDPQGPLGTGFNLSDALSVTFCP